HLALVAPLGLSPPDDLRAPTVHADVPDGAAMYSLEGRVQGRILRDHRGDGGFGYDPLFLYEPTGLTFAEMTSAAKNAVSHRGRALAELAECLQWLTSAGS
ncbi:MAG: non-canonical purine NTP pyrophosphatase, partial [Myxococcota bacterium]|nr:non-canonical purine NTP pyrophosphatase [Myxococcota bacterium]